MKTRRFTIFTLLVSVALLALLPSAEKISLAKQSSETLQVLGVSRPVRIQSDLLDSPAVAWADVAAELYAEALPPAASAKLRAAVQEKLRRKMYHLSTNSLALSLSWTATGEAANNLFGISVGTAGDVNGDGFDDVIVGAQHTNNKGRAYVYQGGPSGLSTIPNFTADGETTGSWFGFPAGTAGDVNGDGYGDVIIADPAYNNYTGRVYVYHGGSGGLSGTPSFVATGEAANNYLGDGVGTAGDVNGDGYDDVIIGGRGYNSYTGRVYVYYGGAGGLNATPSFVVSGEAPNNWFGHNVATAGDVNGDGYDDVIVGARHYNGDTGRVYVYQGGPGGLSTTPSFVATGETASSQLGYGVGTAGDVNGDGYDDVIIGAYAYNNITGRAYVYHGGPSGLSTTPSFVATGEAAEDHYGLSVGTAGDVNGDGFDDVIVGAMGHNSRTGRAYLYQGGPSGLSPTSSWTADGEGTFGYSVGTAGDVNGDGYDDVIVGAWGYNNTTGRAYVYQGGAGLEPTPNTFQIRQR